LQNPHPGVGPGVIGSLEAPLTVPDFLALVKEVTGTPFLRYTTCEQQVVKKVALCGGAGSFLLGAARRAGAGAFLTADLKYHDFHDAHGNLLLVDAGHFETEQFAREVLKDILCQNFPNFAVLISNVNTNPVNYL
ncbi:MAG TPA: Nif3-like dinuclear metal center hexameric protein, partial [Bacteroidales bacterium]|nr:Nif3-like dinuclear metal center hexameric protein [Bacteroidales bacterium]